MDPGSGTGMTKIRYRDGEWFYFKIHIKVEFILDSSGDWPAFYASTISRIHLTL